MDSWVESRFYEGIARQATRYSMRLKMVIILPLCETTCTNHFKPSLYLVYFAQQHF